MDLKIYPIKPKRKAHIPTIVEPLPQLHFILGIVGCMKAGKSVVIANLLSRFYRGVFTNVFFISPTFDKDPAYNILKIEDSKIYDDFNDSVLNNILNTVDESREEDKDANSLIIFDDCSSNTSIFKANFQGRLSNLIQRHRHQNISMIFSLQNYMRIPSGLRDLISYWVFFKIANNNEANKISKEQASDVSKPKFMELLQQATAEPHNFLYINKPDSTYYHNFTDKIHG